MNNQQNTKFIDTFTKLNQLVEELKQHQEIAVDTESNGLYAYQEQVCLLQFSTEENDYVVDPLVVEDLSPLADIFRSEQITKIFHAAEYDVICLKRDYGFEINNLFDTMLASRVAGIKTLGLGKILQEYFHVKAQKKYQRANWGKRPLTSEMIDYATTDTHYLIPLKKILLAKLVELNRVDLADEEFSRISRVNGAERTTLKDHLRKLAISNKLDSQENAVIFELLKARDKKARKRDVPVFKVIGDKSLVAIAQEMPRNFRDLSQIYGVSPRLIKRHASWLLKAVNRGLENEGIKFTRKNDWDPAYFSRLDKIKRWRRKTGIAMQVESDVILPREIMETLADQNPSSLKEVQQIMASVPWRMKRYQDEILELFVDH